MDQSEWLASILFTPMTARQILADLKEAQAIATEGCGFVQPVDTASPGGHGRTFV